MFGFGPADFNVRVLYKLVSVIGLSSFDKAAGTAIHMSLYIVTTSVGNANNLSPIEFIQQQSEWPKCKWSF